MLNVALAVLLDTTEVALAKKREYRIAEISTGYSTTPLPESLKVTGHSLTYAISVPRATAAGSTAPEAERLSPAKDIATYSEQIYAHLSAVSILPVNESDQDIVSKILADNVPPWTKKRVLKPRNK